MSNYESYLNSSLEYLKQYITNMNTRPILFIGSGLSQRYIKSPTWFGLLNQLIEENPEITMPLEYFIQEYDGDYAKISSELVDFYQKYSWENRSNNKNLPPFLFKSPSKSIHLKYKVATIFKNVMAQFSTESHELHEEIRLLKKLNPQAIITTNYDTLLETLFPKYETIVGQQIIYQKKSTDIGHILKIHGSVEDCQSIVIEQKDYDNFFEKDIYLTAKLFTYFMEHPIIFIGYSLSDENIKSILYNMKQIIDSDTEPIIENMWFIDWSKEPINPDTTPPKEINISVGNGESVRVNYIKLHNYERLYESLYQDSMDVEFLKQIEENIYNVVKSDTITDLEVDMASLHHLTDRDSLLALFASTPPKTNDQGTSPLLTFAQIDDPNQLALQFTLTPTELSSRVFDKQNHFWSHAYRLIDDIYQKTGVNLRENNNKYHVEMNGVSRYSMEMVNVLKNVKDMIPCTIEIGDKEVHYPTGDINM